MLDADTKRRIDTARDILVGKVPDPKSQVEQITIALIYKFMDDIDADGEELGGERRFFAGDFAKFGWSKLMDRRLGGHEMLSLYAEAITRMPENPGIPPLFRDIFNNAYLPYRDPETLRQFLRIIGEFTYDHSADLGDPFEYLLSVLGSQGDAGQFRTPRHIINFIVSVVDPKKDEVVLDPACGTAGFLISAYTHMLAANTDSDGQNTLTPDDKTRIAGNFGGYDISPDMVRLSLVNMFLHGFSEPHIHEYDTLTSDERWNEYADVILANPPFMSPKGGIRPHNRFSVQSTRSEVLFVDYMAEHLTANGRAGIIVPEGIIFQSQNAHKRLRKMLVEEYLVAVVSLPAGVFKPYSGVKTSVLILDRALARQTDRIAFFKVASDGFDLGDQRRPIDRNDLPHVQAELASYLRRGRAGESMDGFYPSLGTVVKKERTSADGSYSLSGDRYQERQGSGSRVWPMVTLESICDRILSGGTPSTAIEHYWNGNIPWITSADIVDLKTAIPRKHITDLAINQSATNLIPKGNVVIVTRVGLGKLFRNDFDVCISQDSQGLILKQGIDADYLVYLLKDQVANFKNISQGSTIQGVTKRQLSEIRIPLPPLEAQQQIVEEIEGFQKVIDGARAVVENYRPQIAVDPEWPMVPLGECSVRVQYGLSVPLNTSLVGYKTFRMNELVQGRTIDFGEMKCADISAEEFAKYRLSRGDILFNRTNSYEHVGRTGIFDLLGDYCFASYLIRLSLSTELANPFYVNAFMNTEGFQLGIKQYATRAIGQSNINAKSLTGYRIPLPPLVIQHGIVADIEAEQTLVNANRELIRRMGAKIQATIERVWSEDGH